MYAVIKATLGVLKGDRERVREAERERERHIEIERRRKAFRKRENEATYSMQGMQVKSERESNL